MYRVGYGGMVVLAAAWLAAGCGSSEDITASGPGTTRDLPTATTTPMTTASPAPGDLCPAPDVARSPSVHSPTDAQREGARQDVLRNDADRARLYGQAHPDAFNQVWMTTATASGSSSSVSPTRWTNIAPLYLRNSSIVTVCWCVDHCDRMPTP